MRLSSLLVLCVLLTANGVDAVTPGQTVTFIACPIYRDTDNGRKSGCWLADDPESGQRFDLWESSTKPMLGRKMLVEGMVVTTASPDLCGGQPLNPVRVSILEARCPETLIPAEGYPSKPSVLPKDFIKPISVPRVKHAPPYARKVFELFFDLHSDYFNYQESDTVIERAAQHAIDSQAKNVTVQGFADREGFMLHGERFAEDARLSERRQNRVKTALVGFGLSASSLRSAGSNVLAPPTTPLNYLGRRRVVITIEP